MTVCAGTVEVPPLARVHRQPAGLPSRRATGPGSPAPPRSPRRWHTRGRAGENSSKSVPMSTSAPSSRERHVDRASRLVAARVGTGPGHPVRVRHRLEHPHLHVVRPVAVPEDEYLTARPQSSAAAASPARHRFVDQAAGIGRIQRHADEVVRRRVPQVDDRIRHDGPHVDQTGGAAPHRKRGEPAVGAPSPSPPHRGARCRR